MGCPRMLFICALLTIGSLETLFAQIPDVEFTIDEELAPTSQIGDISLYPDLFPGTTEEDRNTFQYGILDQASQPASLFNITRNGGVIYVAKRIDREELCFGLPDCILNINVLTTSSEPSQIDSQVVLVSITVHDINDNAPTFGRDSVILEVSEGNAPNSVLKISGANDRDYMADFKVKNYTLNGYRDVFQLTASRALDGSSEIDLKLLTSLDRERRERYQFSISAYDGGVPPLSAILFIIIRVTDKNDNAPIFLNESYSASIDSTTEVNSVILRVSAVDEDEGSNRDISFDFSNLQKPVLAGIFQINSSTGEISVVGPLKPGVINFIVVAQDGGNPPLKSQTEVTINVVSTGNLAPVVAIRTLGTGREDNTISILEPGGRGLFVALVDVDDDGGRDGVLCEISNEVFRMESIPNKGYKISLQGFVDRETQSSYNLSVVCTDRGNPPLNTTQHFLVKIDDANDNKPIFNQMKYSRTLTEGRKLGEYVLQVGASDKDIGQNGNIRYSIDPNYASMFNVNPVSGVVTAIGVLDREVSQVINFNVYASDQGKPPKQTSVLVSVILEDINDHSPVFTKKVFHFKTREEVQGQRVINDLTAEDKDIGLNSQLEYFFTGSTDGADSAFTVMTNGSIVSSKRLDREERANYTFTVMVRDRGTPPKMSSASVVIEITDINDNSPYIQFPKTKNYTIPLSTVPETGVVLGRIIAYDDDDGENGSLRYTIVSGNEDRAFAIGEATGEFVISNAHRLKNGKQYDVYIVVSDHGNPPKANTTSFRIDVFFDNATNEYLEEQKEKQEDYIVIVAVVVAITGVFSTLIIVAICIVLQKDRFCQRKSNNQKTVFHNINHHQKLSEGQKVRTRSSNNAESNTQRVNQKDSMTGPSNGSQNANGPYFQERFSFSEGNSGTKGKAVTFSLFDEQSTSKTPGGSSPRAQTPPLSTFGSNHRIRPSDDILHQRMSMTRQVSGAKYTSVSTCVHGDDVRSDTSADTTTSDSGRGNSVDDVNFEQIIKSPGDLSPQLSLPPRQPITAPEIPERSSTRVRFNKPMHQTDRDKMADTRLKSLSDHYGGARSASNVPRRAINESGLPLSSSRPTPTKGGGQHITSSRPSKYSTISTQHHASVTSLDDDATTTTSGSYVINPDDVKLEAYVGSDVVV